MGADDAETDATDATSVSAGASERTLSSRRTSSQSSLLCDVEGTTITAGGRKRRHAIPFKGVYRCKLSSGDFWQSQISIDGTTFHLGVFDDINKAARAYDTQARALNRQLNFPNDPLPEAPAPPLGPPIEMWVPDEFNDLDEEKQQAFWEGYGIQREAAHKGARMASGARVPAVLQGKGCAQDTIQGAPQLPDLAKARSTP